MPVWQTSTGIHGSIQVLQEERIPLKNQKEKWIPGLRIPLQRAWVTTEIEFSDGMSAEPMSPPGQFSRVAPEFVDTDHLPPGVVIDLKKAAQYRDDWRKEPMKALEAWLDGDEAKQFYGLERGDPRGKRPVRMTMTAEDHEKFLQAKADGKLDVHEITQHAPDANAAQKVHQGTRTVR